MGRKAGEVKGRRVKKEKLLVGGFYSPLIFHPRSLLCGCASCDDV